LAESGDKVKKVNQGEIMPDLMENRKEREPINILDALLYLVAGSAMTIISVTFLLWLQF
jgi:hypothetical protein